MSDLMPWEKEGETFDAEKAKTLILNLKAESKEKSAKLAERDSQIEQLSGERDSLPQTVEEQKATLQLAQEDLSSKESKISEIETLRSKENLLMDKGLPRKFASFIPDGDEETMTSAVEEFASLRGTDGARVPFDPAQVAEPAVDARQELANQVFGA